MYYTKICIGFNSLYSFSISSSQVLDDEGTWWKMRCGNTYGYASKYYFVHKEYDEDYKKEPWYFGDMSREEAVRLLEDTANPDG